MKWLCLTVLVLDLIMVGIAGFRFLTVDETRVNEIRVVADEHINKASARAASMDGLKLSEWNIDLSTHGSQPAEEDITYERPAEEDENNPDAIQSAYTGRAGEAQFIVDQSAAMQMTTMPGVQHTRENLREIEASRRDSKAYGQQAME